MREINYTDSRKEEKKWQQRVGVIVPGLALLAFHLGSLYNNVLYAY